MSNIFLQVFQGARNADQQEPGGYMKTDDKRRIRSNENIRDVYNQRMKQNAKTPGRYYKDKIPTKENILPKTQQSKRITTKTSHVANESPVVAIGSVVNVYLRIRPLINDEEHAEFSIEDNVVLATPQKTSVFQAQRKFTFTEVFDHESGQSSIFESVAMPMLKQFIKGYDGLLFAYGATSAGKTHTIRGTEDDPGLLPRIVKLLLATTPPANMEKGLFVSCIEVYNERIHDLLGDATKPLRIGKDGFGFTVVKDAKELEIKSCDQIGSILQTIDQAKKVCATAFNQNSSRSHCIFMLKFISIPLDPDTGLRCSDLSKISATRLSVVDLAGSEKVSPSETNNRLVSEACNINKSMLVLGKCIREIRRINSGILKGVQVPFRESKLTELFRDFFDPVNGRRTYCAIIVNISPSSKQFDDTLFSLQFAAEAVECSVKSTPISSDSEDIQPMEIENDFEEMDADLMNNEAMVYKEIRNEVTRRLLDIQSSFQQQIECIKAQSAQPYTSKLQRALSEKLVNESTKRELEDINKQRNQSMERLKELQELVNSLESDKATLISNIEQVRSKLESETEKCERFTSAISRMIEGTQKLQQRQLELQGYYESNKNELMAQYESRIKELEERLSSK